MKYLAKYFLETISIHDISHDLSRQILPKAACVCTEMILSIEVDSSLLLSIPLSMFHNITQMLSCSHSFDFSSSEKRIHTCSLIALYLEHDVEDNIFCLYYFVEYIHMEGVTRFWFPACDEIGADGGNTEQENDIELALTWFRVEQNGWK